MHGIPFDSRLDNVSIRPLEDGDSDTVELVLAQLRTPPADTERFSQQVLIAYADGRPVGLGRLALDDDPTVAEITVAVADAWRRAGIGGELMRVLGVEAAAIGVQRVRAVMRLENTGSMALARRLTRIVSFRIDAGELQLTAIV